MVQQSSRLPRRTTRPVVRRGSSLEVAEVQDRARSPIRVSGREGAAGDWRDRRLFREARIGQWSAGLQGWTLY